MAGPKFKTCPKSKTCPKLKTCPKMRCLYNFVTPTQTPKLETTQPETPKPSHNIVSLRSFSSLLLSLLGILSRSTSGVLFGVGPFVVFPDSRVIMEFKVALGYVTLNGVYACVLSWLSG